MIESVEPARRVLVFGSSADLYGAPRVLAASVQALRSAGWRVVVVLPATGPLTNVLIDLGAVVHTLPDFALRRRDLHARGICSLVLRHFTLARWLIRQRRINSFDLVYSNTQSIVIGPLAAAVLKAPHLWHVHEILDSPRWLARLLATAVWLGSTVIVCPSQAIADHLAALAPRGRPKTVVVPNGIDAPELLRLPAPARGASLRVGCIARLHPWKGQAIAIEATRLARSAGVPVELTLFGDAFEGNETVRAHLEDLVTKLGLGDHVRLAGHVDDQVSIYEALDVVVVPSTSPEPFSLVCLEAHVAARPVVASDAGGPKEIIEDRVTGLLFEPGSAPQLAEALTFIWQHGGRAMELAEAGRAQVARKYSPAAFTSNLVSTIESICRVDS